jgi:large subunit ribosomal protein L17
MLRALTANLVAHERIETTDAKAKELKRVAERVITRAIRLGPVAYTPHDKLSTADRARRLAAQRQVGRFLQRFAVVNNGESTKVDLIEKVFVDLAKRFRDRPGGYTRIVKIGRRRGDNAPMSIVELVTRGAEADAKADKPAKAKATAAKDEAAETAEEPKAKRGAKAEAKAEAEAEAEAAAPAEAAAADKPAKKSRAEAKKDDETGQGEEEGGE